MTDYYPALIRKDADSDFGVEFPDLPGCITAADTIDAALHHAEEALRFHVDGMLEDGEPVPPPTPIEHILESEQAHGAAIYLVRLLQAKGRAVRVNITLEENLLEQIDIEATRSGMSRSGFLSEAARTTLDERFVRRLEEKMNDPGQALDHIRQVAEEDEKARVLPNLPPDTSKIGRAHRDS